MRIINRVWIIDDMAKANTRIRNRVVSHLVSDQIEEATPLPHEPAFNGLEVGPQAMLDYLKPRRHHHGHGRMSDFETLPLRSKVNLAIRRATNSGMHSTTYEAIDQRTNHELVQPSLGVSPVNEITIKAITHDILKLEGGWR